jgi:YidC/Oxa1 family membrane protein insertase
VLYVGTQLAATAVTAFSADPTQRRIMFALPFVFTIFIINFQAGLIVYWITTNVWTIGQQLVVRKLYPKPQVLAETGRLATADDADNGGKPARGKPASAAKDDGDNGAAAAKAPPGSPRKKKKRSGRRR